MNYFLLTFVVVCCCISGSCNSNNTSTQVNNIKKSVDTIKKQIQIDKKGKVDYNYVYIKQKTRQLGLDSLERGYDSMQVRIWMDYSLAKSQHLFVFKQKGKEWAGELITYSTNTETPDYEKVLSKEISRISPKDGWNTFIRELNALGINNLNNSGKEIGGADGVSYCIEVATNQVYNYSRFWSPEYDAAKDEQSANIVKIINLLEREFNFKRSQQ